MHVCQNVPVGLYIHTDTGKAILHILDNLEPGVQFRGGKRCQAPEKGYKKDTVFLFT